MRLYPIWNNNSHGPLCGPSDIVDFCSEGQEPADVIFCADEEDRHLCTNLCTRLRLLGWDDIASQLEGGE